LRNAFFRNMSRSDNDDFSGNRKWVLAIKIATQSICAVIHVIPIIVQP